MILVFGKTGQLGKELKRFASIVTLGREDANLCNSKACKDAIQSYRPKAVINAAAYTAVDKAEDEECLATVVNGETPKTMAQTCADLGIPIVHISTDYVFEGTRNRAWRPTDPTAPQNAYGRSKLQGELGIRNSGATHAILRTSWVVSAHGNNFIKSILRASEMVDELSVVADQVGGPTPARDIAAACLVIAERLLQDPSKSGTYHFSGKPNVSWANFAIEIFDQLDKSVKINHISTQEYPTKAKRPLNSRLDCKTLERTFGITQPEWRKGLNEILRELEAES